LGLPFGTAVWLAADEGVVPALGLSQESDKYPLSTHAYALASHLVYGLTTELMLKVLLPDLKSGRVEEESKQSGEPIQFRR
jgi:hypothetical protein